MEQNDEITQEGRFQRRDGSTFPVRVHIRRHEIDGEARFIAIARDISEQKQREEQLERFASVVSHDLQNPLQVAAAHLELARDNCDNQHLDRVQNAHERMETLIDDFLQFARYGNQLKETEPVDLAALLRECWQDIDTSEAKLRSDVDCYISADRSRLKQLFENLYLNAVQHGGDDVTVSVELMTDGFAVADTGTGIPESDREEIFQPGYSMSKDGTGFGLQIVEQVANGHGWEVTVTESEQGGARFEFTGVQFRE